MHFPQIPSLLRPLGRAALVTALLVVPGSMAIPEAVAAEQGSAAIVVYFLDHQFLPAEELTILQDEVAAIFATAQVEIQWELERSPLRDLNANELRLVILPSDGTRWFHGPSNVIGIAPHDDDGTGRNCFIFYRQAIWFRQQAVFRCREAIQARTEAQIRGVDVDPFIDGLAPENCGDYLPALTSLIVARAAAHEMVHILLNKLDHGESGLMRNSFDVGDWFTDDRSLFELATVEIEQLRELLAGVQ